MGPLILVALVGAIVTLIGFLLYGMLLGVQALGRTLLRLFWPDLPEVERRAHLLPETEIAVSRSLTPVERCWDIKQCLQGKRDKCPAFKKRNLPCWLANMRAGEGYRLKPECVACTQFSLPAMLN